jgi:hypothetical protein
MTDSREERVAAARRYMATVPVLQQMYESFYANLTGAEEDRARYRRAFTSRSEAFEEAIEHALVEAYAAPEIDALAHFYGSPEGRVILGKFPRYSALVAEKLGDTFAAINQELFPEEK